MQGSCESQREVSFSVNLEVTHTWAVAIDQVEDGFTGRQRLHDHACDAPVSFREILMRIIIRMSIITAYWVTLLSTGIAKFMEHMVCLAVRPTPANYRGTLVTQ